LTIYNEDYPTMQYSSNNITCSHTETINENNIIICIECGEEIQHTVMHEKEWKYYGANSHTSDPNRIQLRKCDEKSIHKDVINMGFSDTIVAKADELYSIVTSGHIYRGNSRKAIVFACIFHAYKLLSMHQTPEQLIKMFGITRKSGLKGLKIVSINSPKDSEVHCTIITPVHLINDIMDKFKATPIQKQEVANIYHSIRNKSSKLNRSRPSSLSSSVVYYWIQKKGINITLKEFAKKVDLSDLTISKNIKEIVKILN
jgi:transcription initiation factor TFIIIB Brf1 subunit/transcription initiation factor TFIIB